MGAKHCARASPLACAHSGVAGVVNPLESGGRSRFYNGKRSSIGVIYFDRTGLCVWSKRLERGRLLSNWNTMSTREMDWTGLKLLLEYPPREADSSVSGAEYPACPWESILSPRPMPVNSANTAPGYRGTAGLPGAQTQSRPLGSNTYWAVAPRPFGRGKVTFSSMPASCVTFCAPSSRKRSMTS